MNCARFIATCLIALTSLLFTLCGEGLAQHRRPRVGAILNLTGPGAYMGVDIRDGFELCSRSELDVRYEDHQGQAVLGVSAFNRLTQIGGIDIAMVTFSGVADALIPIALSRKVPLFLTLVSSEKVVARGKESVVNFFSTGEQDGYLMGRFLGAGDRYARAATMFLAGEFGESYRQAFQRGFEDQGGTLTASERFGPDEVDFRTTLLKVKSSGAQVLYFASYDAHSIAIVKQAKELRLDLRLAGTWSNSAPQLRKDYPGLLEGLITTAPEYYFSNSPAVARFAADFEARFQRSATAYAAQGCDAARLFLYYGDREPGRFIRDLRQLKGFEGVMGKLSASPAGSIEFPLVPAEIRSDTLVRLDR